MTAKMMDLSLRSKAATLYDGLSPICSALVIVLVLLVAGLSARSFSVEGEGLPSSPQSTDADLYRGIIADVAKGEGYYAVAVRAHRAGNYPLRPFVTMRSPLLAVMSAKLGPLGTKLLLAALVVAVSLAWWSKLKSCSLPRPVGVAVAVAVPASALLVTMPFMSVYHESWAVLLIAASVVLRTPDRFIAAVLLGVVAAMFRELAAVYLIVMFVAAMLERHWREMLGWGLAMLAVIAFYGLHAYLLEQHLGPSELRSPGWTGLGGWSFFLFAVRETSWLNLLPWPIAHALVPLSLFGWASMTFDFTRRVTATMMAFAVLIACFARPVNFYWSLFNTPFTIAGIAFGFFALSVLAGNVAAGLQTKKAA